MKRIYQNAISIYCEIVLINVKFLFGTVDLLVTQNTVCLLSIFQNLESCHKTGGCLLLLLPDLLIVFQFFDPRIVQSLDFLATPWPTKFLFFVLANVDI